MTMSDVEILIPQDLVSSVVFYTKRLFAARSLEDQMWAGERLRNHIADLATWHPDFDYETGNIEDGNVVE